MHDRWFLDKAATDILAFEGERQPVWFPGGYSRHSQTCSLKRRGQVEVDPTRIKYTP